MIACPAASCSESVMPAAALADHLVQTHGVLRASAIRIAQEEVARVEAPPPTEIAQPDASALVSESIQEEKPMAVYPPKVCGGCDATFQPHTGNARYCAACRERACTYCKRLGESHAASCSRATKKPSTNGHDPKAAGQRAKSIAKRIAAKRKQPALASVLARLDAEIGTAEQRLADLRTARRVLAAHAEATA